MDKRNKPSSLLSVSPVSVSKRPWFITYDKESKVVFIWKNDIRLKLKDGRTSAASVTCIRLCDADNGIVEVS